jgi:hypothetical protein
MFKRIPNFVLWILLGCAVATVPLACSSSGTDSARDSGREAAPSNMTGS